MLLLEKIMHINKYDKLDNECWIFLVNHLIEPAD